ncbi:hypothetical protein D1F64_07835 [Breoghania sp. L-A4]|nr:hypothetical protein D1F64_07835 [Breoghania sp. L-A4]
MSENIAHGIFADIPSSNLIDDALNAAFSALQVVVIGIIRSEHDVTIVDMAIDQLHIGAIFRLQLTFGINNIHQAFNSRPLIRFNIVLQITFLYGISSIPRSCRPEKINIHIGSRRSIRERFKCLGFKDRHAAGELQSYGVIIRGTSRIFQVFLLRSKR